MTSPEQNLGICGICQLPAQFTDAAPGANPVSYCSMHLPAHLQTAAQAGQMPLAAEATTVAELREEAKELNIPGRSSMDKEHLASAVATAHALDLRPVEDDVDPAEMTDAPTSDEVLPVEEPPPAPKKAARKK